MFDLDYNANVPFVPIAMTVKAKMKDVATSEELEETNEHVETLSGTVSEQGQAIAENAAAIQNETEARENAVEELNDKIIDSAKLKIEVVDTLPAVGDTSTIYLLKVSDASGNKYKEYVYSNGEWEEIGSVVDLSDYATKDDLEELQNKVYTKGEVDTLLASLAVKADVDVALDLKADADAVYTKDEADAKFLTDHQDISGLATKDELSNAMDEVYTKSEADAKFLTEHQDISGLATKDELADAMDNVYTKDEADAKFLTEHQDITMLATKTEVEKKADADNVYTKAEADAKFLTEHQDITGLATKDELATAMDTVYTKAEADAKFLTEHQDISNKVDWVESTPGRKHIVLPNHDSILGTATDAQTYNLAMVSKWDVADFGSSSLHANINSKDGVVTINDTKQIATTDQIPDVSGFATKAQLEDETATREQAIADLHEEIVALPKFKIVIVVSLPVSGDEATLYLVKTGDETGNEYTEYVFVNGEWEEIGTQELDLTDYAKVADLDTLSGVVENLLFEFDSVDEKLAGLAEANANQDIEIAKKANSDDVYSKAEADAKFLTEHQDISGLATKAEVEAVDAKVDAIVIPDLTDYAKSADVTAEIAAAVAIIATKDEEQDNAIEEVNSGLTELEAVKADKAELEALIAAKEAEIYNLTKIVGDLGGAVTYDVPGEHGKSFTTLMNNNGTVKLADDVTSGRFGPGITAKNAVKLNLNNHDLTFTGLTTATAQGAIMARGTQEITIGGKGTVDAGEGICIEGNGASSVINLTGSTTVYRTDRSGGELVYCYAGTINITNGTFRNDGADKKYMLNCYDANYANGTAKIVVTGGKFYDFNPADNSAEGEHTSFVPAGYEAVASTVVEEGVEYTVYTVKKSS